MEPDSNTEHTTVVAIDALEGNAAVAQVRLDSSAQHGAACVVVHASARDQIE